MWCLFMSFSPSRLFPVFFALVSVASADFKAMVDETSEDREKYGFGSLIKDKGSALHSIFSKSDDPGKLKATKTETEKKAKTPFEKTWNTILGVIEDLPLKKLDAENGFVETQSVSIESFDSTETCKYQIYFKVEPDGKFSVDVKSDEDSKVRIEKFKELIAARVNRALG